MLLIKQSRSQTYNSWTSDPDSIHNVDNFHLVLLVVTSISDKKQDDAYNDYCKVDQIKKGKYTFNCGHVDKRKFLLTDYKEGSYSFPIQKSYSQVESV